MMWPKGLQRRVGPPWMLHHDKVVIYMSCWGVPGYTAFSDTFVVSLNLHACS